MSWNRQTIEPDRPQLKHASRHRYPSPPLCRLCGAIGFTVVGLLILRGGTTLWGVNPGFLLAQGHWGFKEIAWLAASLLAAMFFGLLGFALGTSVEVRSEKTNHVLAVLWHYLANGSLIWCFLLALALTKTLGQEGAKRHIDDLGLWHSTLAIAGTGGLGSIAIALLLLATRQLRFQTRPKFLLCSLLALPLSMAMGYTQFRLLDLNASYWVIISVLFPLALLPSAAMTIAHDAQQRQQMLSMMKD